MNRPPLPLHASDFATTEVDSEGVEGSSDSGPPPQWNDFFDDWRLVEFCAHENSSEEEVARDSFSVYTAGDSGPTLVFLHGAGHTALSWALVAKEVKASCRVIAYDARGHGKTKCANSSDLSAETLIADGIRIIREVVSRDSVERSDEDSNHVVLIGHSMGGAIATKIAHSGDVEKLYALIILDVVEGTAMSALPLMKSFVSRFPKSFESTDAAVAWSLKAGILTNATSARISIPSQLELRSDNRWHWILDLLSTEEFWAGWFMGMSAMFVESKRCAKVLVLAGEDRLDKTMMIAQMQGKFQFVVVSKSGHILEEDQPAQTAGILLNFLRRHKLLHEDE